MSKDGNESQHRIECLTEKTSLQAPKLRYFKTTTDPVTHLPTGTKFRATSDAKKVREKVFFYWPKFILREKVLAKLKLSTQSDFDPGVETDEQIWSLIKK